MAPTRRLNMTYGEDKQRDMIRSILPSKSRKSARANLAGAKRRHRSRVNQNLNKYRGAYLTEAEDIYDEDGFDYNSYPDEEISEFVWERRNGDKDAPLVRWAAAQVQDIRLKDRLSHIRAMLPDNTIGRHAADHCRWDDAFWIPDTSYWWWRLSDEQREARAALRTEERKRERQLAKDLLLQVLATNGAHKKFNSLCHGVYRYRMFFDTKAEAESVIKNRGSMADHPRLDGEYSVESTFPSYSKADGAWVLRVSRKRVLEGSSDVEAFLDHAHGWTVSTITYKRRLVRDDDTWDDILRSRVQYDAVEDAAAPAYKNSAYQGVIEAACRALNLRKETR